jgi:outer membrane protein
MKTTISHKEMFMKIAGLTHRLLVMALLTAGLLSASTHVLRAQEKVSLSVDQAIAIGIENSKSLHASQMRVESADARSSEVGVQRLPQIKLGASYTRLSDVPPFVIGPLPPLLPGTVTLSPSLVDNYSARLTLQQPLFTGFRLQGLADGAEYSAKAASEEFAKDKSDLVYGIRSAYWSLYKANEFKKVVDENVGQVRAHLNDVKNLFAQGIVTKNEVLKVEVQLSNVLVLQLDAANNVRLAMLGLNNILGTPLTNEVELTTGITRQPQEYGGADALVSRALDRRPELRAMDDRVKAGESAVTAARSGWFPQVYLTGNYTYARPNQRIFPSIDQFKDTWDVSLSVSLDIWNWGTTIHQTNQAQAQLAQARDGLGQLRDGITLEVTQNLLNLNETRDKIAVAEQGVAQAEENYRITNEKFKSGLALNSDLLDAEVALLQAKWNSIQALVDHELADARLRKALGDDLAGR